jgi:hypothetical protein
VSLVDTAAVEVVLGLVPCRAGDSNEVDDRSSPTGSPRSTARTVSTAGTPRGSLVQRGSGDVVEGERRLIQIRAVDGRGGVREPALAVDSGEDDVES